MNSFRHLLISQLMSSEDWTGKPSDWADIRVNCPKKSIALYAAHKSDYSQYDNLGFTATISNSGKYKVFIDGTQYGDDYDSGATCTITWSTSGITTGDDITTPSALKAHKIWIEPATTGNNITAFHCARVAASGTEEQGVLWEHFNLSNLVDISRLNATGSLSSQDYSNPALVACTAKNNTLQFTGMQYAFLKCENLTYVPTFDRTNSNAWTNLLFAFSKCYLIEKVNFKNTLLSAANYAFTDCYNLKEINGLTMTSNATSSLERFIVAAENFKQEEFDLSELNKLKILGIYGTWFDKRRFMTKLKRVRVSNEAPFDSTSTPQINVSYTGMDRAALVQLFNDLPYNVGYTVVGSPTINNGVVSGFSSSDYIIINKSLVLTESDSSIFNVKFKTSATNSNETLFRGNKVRAHIRTDSRLQLTYNIPGIGNKFFIGSTTLQPNTLYSISYVIDALTKTISLYISENGGEPVLDNVFDDGTIPLEESPITYGYDSSSATGIFNGLLYCEGTSIIKNNITWFNGKAAMTKTLSCVGATGNQTQLTVVGNPTISDGKVSGFTTNDYIRLQPAFHTYTSTANSWEVVFHFKFMRTILPSAGTDYDAQALYGRGGGWNSILGIYNPTKILYMNLTNGTSGGYNICELAGTTELEENNWYYAKYYFTGTKYGIALSLTGEFQGEENIEKEVATSVKYTYADYPFSLGACMPSGTPYSRPFQGIIDLDNSYFIFDDKKVFAKGQYLLPEDKDIALNKGWSLTLS